MNTLSRRIEAARRYAALARSDPFAFSRALTHINNGIVSYLQDGREALYDADRVYEERAFPDHSGRTYIAETFKNGVRP